MITTLVKKLFGSRNERVLKQTQKTVSEINALEPACQALTDEQLRAKTNEFKQRFQQGATLDALLPEAFAVVREVSVRTMGLRHFDVQLIGGMILHQGNIAEMRTGEGKTLMSTLPTYLNALTGEGVHIITVNDYLATRDSEWMKPIYEFLGLTLGVILPTLSREEKQTAYQADITYGTNNEFGFDYLRDNMAFSPQDKVQRASLHYAIVDEVDSILIDEARTPLIISGAAEDSSDMYRKINELIPILQLETEGNTADYTLDEKTRQAYLTETGHQKVEELLEKAGLIKAGESLYSPTNITLMHHINAGLRAHHLYQNDVEYMVKDNEIVIVDEHTGRTMPGRRWSEGLHQAIEAKENVPIQQENQTLASITFQNYFRLYDKLSGMTGTADTEAYEFQQIYNLEVIVIPTNKPMVRNDETDKVFITQEEKFMAILDDIKQCQARQQPVLVGTASIENSELLSRLLKKEGIKHQVLNAKFHQKEATIIAEAGRPGVVTIATNMAGRGTDIVLGGNLEAEYTVLPEETETLKKQEMREAWEQRHEQVINAGGLRIIGTERHESRRIDNQLRGRAGRQGDPGSSCFYLSFEDNLLRIFASERMAGLMQRLQGEKGEAISSVLVSRAIENAQRKVEGHNFDIRKQLLEYDDVANEQRKVIYQQRNEIMLTEQTKELTSEFRREVLKQVVMQHMPPDTIEDMWDVEGLTKRLEQDFLLSLPIATWLEEDKTLDTKRLFEKLIELEDQAYQKKRQEIGDKSMDQFEKSIILQSIDNHWREHLAAMDHLRQGIHLRGYAQKDPKQEYKREAFTLFTELVDRMRYEAVSVIDTVQIRSQEEVDAVEEQRRQASELDHQYQHEATEFFHHESQQGPDEAETTETYVRDQPKVGRNEPCPCGSEKKYKQCHGRL